MDPDWLRTEPPEHPWIRVGVAGEWGFALDESMGGSGGYENDAAAALAAGFDVVLLTHTQTIDDFCYCSGALVTGAERIRPHVQRLLAGGVTADAITARTGNWLSPVAIDAVLRGVNITIPVRTAEQVLAMQVPSSA